MNYFNFSKYTIAVIIVFCLALVCVMFNPLINYLIIPALLLLSVGTFIVGFNFIKSYKNKKEKFAFNQEEIIMELASTEDGEKYIAEKGSYVKKLKKRMKSAKWELIWPILACMIASLLLFGLMIKYIIGLF